MGLIECFPPACHTERYRNQGRDRPLCGASRASSPGLCRITSEYFLRLCTWGDHRRGWRHRRTQPLFRIRTLAYMWSSLYQGSAINIHPCVDCPVNASEVSYSARLWLPVNPGVPSGCVRATSGAEVTTEIISWRATTQRSPSKFIAA